MQTVFRIIIHYQRRAPEIPLYAHRGRNLGPYEHVSMPTLCQPGKKDLIKTWVSGDKRERAFLLQKVSLSVQRFNAILLHDTLPATDCMDLSTQFCIQLNFKLHYIWLNNYTNKKII